MKNKTILAISSGLLVLALVFVLILFHNQQDSGEGPPVSGTDKSQDVIEAKESPEHTATAQIPDIPVVTVEFGFTEDPKTELSSEMSDNEVVDSPDSGTTTAHIDTETESEAVQTVSLEPTTEVSGDAIDIQEIESTNIQDKPETETRSNPDPEPGSIQETAQASDDSGDIQLPEVP